MSPLFKKTFVLFSLATVLFTACSKKKDDVIKEPEVSLDLKLAASATFGSVITDGTGKALYCFVKDANSASTCVDGCLITWPVYYAENATPPVGLNAADIATITRADGTKQTTYKGWPLYYYAGDKAKDEIKGDGVGGIWFVAKPDYSVMMASQQLVGHDGKNYTADSKEGVGITVYLTDPKGRTLYAFTPDTFNKNNFTKPDLSNNAVWPIFESEILNVPSVLKKADFTVITSVGKNQLTYKGHPLYYFGSDAAKGETKGVSYPKPGVWPILTLNTPPLN
jgi:predicted lipoprotein with Yx(FWY)xxD motif